MINHSLHSAVLGNCAFALPPASNAAIFSASGSGFGERDGSWSVPAELRGSPSREEDKGRQEIRQRMLLRITSPCAPLATGRTAAARIRINPFFSNFCRRRRPAQHAASPLPVVKVEVPDPKVLHTGGMLFPGLARARAKLGFANLVTNMRRLAWFETRAVPG
jgi:hypothetical protein